MKPFTKGLWLGILIGFLAALCVALAGILSLGVLMNTSLGRGMMADVVLRPLSFPAEGEIESRGTLDPELALTTLDGETIRLAELRGRPVFLNVWATWCYPCVMEMPSIVKLRDSLRDDGVAFALISDEDPEVVRRFVRDEGLELPVYLVSGQVPEPVQSEILPTTVILDPRGRIVFRHAGAADWDDDGCREFLRSLAGRPGEDATGQATPPAGF